MAWIRGRLAQDGHRPPKTIKAQRDQVQAHLAGLEKDVQAASTLDTAEERLQELRNMLAEVQQQLMQIGPEMDATADPLMTELELQQQAVTAEQARLQLEIEHSDHVQKLNEVRGLRNHRAEARRVAESLVQASQVRIRDADRRLATLTGEAERLQDAARVCAEAESQIAKLETEATDWALLARACGSNGVPALEIDAAGPAISALVNDLLAACFSTRFSVQVQTQKQAADGKRLLEDFSLRVIDTERGRDGTLDDLSGGERIIVAEALAMGIAIYNKGQHHLSTLFRDETTGQLDVATAPKYVQMLRRAMALGQFHRVLFITHSPDCAALADAVIRCNNGTIAVEI
jgi:exonuclease SbcC